MDGENCGKDIKRGAIRECEEFFEQKQSPKPLSFPKPESQLTSSPRNGTTPLQRNSFRCPHCRRLFFQSAETPLINRSDGKRFHLALFSGPEARRRSSGVFQDDQLICHFLFANDQFGPSDHTVYVIIVRAEQTQQEVLDQIEAAADKLAELVEAEGTGLNSEYTFDGRRLTQGFPILPSGENSQIEGASFCKASGG